MNMPSDEHQLQLQIPQFIYNIAPTLVPGGGAEIIHPTWFANNGFSSYSCVHSGQFIHKCLIRADFFRNKSTSKSMPPQTSPRPPPHRHPSTLNFLRPSLFLPLHHPRFARQTSASSSSNRNPPTMPSPPTRHLVSLSILPRASTCSPFSPVLPRGPTPRSF